VNRASKLAVNILICVLGLGGIYVNAQDAGKGEKLKLVVILSRHGVRSPTWTLDRLNTYSSQPWPAWSVEPGILTTRGYDLLKRFGSYDRAALSHAGLISAQGCGDVSSAYVWADTDQRTIASGHALAESLYPGCALEVHSLAEGQNDPIFHPGTDGLSAATADAAFADLSKRVDDLPKNPAQELLTQLQRILMGCKADADCTPTHAPQMLLDGKTAAARGTGDKFVSLKGPIPLGSSLAEDLLLEYAEGIPMNSVGWGHADEAEISHLLALHSIYFGLIHQTPALAKIEASSMLQHMTATLEQGATGKSVEGAKGKPGDKVVFFVGHDTNIGGVAALLGAHWNLDGRDDDTPPGTELSFELWQSAKGTYSIRVKVAMQTLHQMREMQMLTLADPPVNTVVPLTGCSGKESACTWEQFLNISKQATNSRMEP
jgi:4-phytase/acid phosphatase